ncbi:hypothetical protein ApDm4_0635 [Acetobacter pomorum]|nr:hypothetical protein ApDm4_0635 [Acetobacter pomorum]
MTKKTQTHTKRTIFMPVFCANDFLWCRKKNQNFAETINEP